MIIQGIPLHDMHLHIQNGHSVGEYLCIARTLGIEIMGITEHLWDITHIPTQCAYYQDKSLEYLLAMRDAAPASQDLKLLWGCETEYAAPIGRIGIEPPQNDLVDYTVVPHSHFFLPGFTFPEDMDQPKDVADYMVKTFLEVASLPVTTVIAHPFDPTAAHFQKEDFLSAIFHHLSDRRLTECFRVAAQKGKIIEINLGSFIYGLKHELYQKTYFPMFAMAKRAGCRFCLASDAQKPEDLYRIAPENAHDVIETLGLTADDICLPGIGLLT